MSWSFTELPKSLPVPVDDGACDHLSGFKIPSLSIPATDGRDVDLSELPGLTVVYCYPRTGEPDKPVAEGWDIIPGARGCTPQTCSFRDHFQELKDLGVDELFGYSSQDMNCQKEVVTRLHLPYPILSDDRRQLIQALQLPTFEFQHYGKLVKRLTLIIQGGKVWKVFYPVFPSDKNVDDVIEWLKKNKSNGGAL